MRQRILPLEKYVRKACYLTRVCSLVGILTVLVGCAGTASSAPRTGVAHSPVPSVPMQDSAKMRFPSLFIYQPGVLRYRLQVASAIQLIGGDSTYRIDSTHVVGNLDVQFSAVPGRDQVVVEVRSDSTLLSVNTGTSVPVISGPPFMFDINSRNGRITSTEPVQNTSCARDSTQQSPFSGREVLPSIQLQPTSTWVDTSATTICRGGVLLVLTQVASYVRVEMPDSAYQLLRSTRVMVSGTGSQWGQRADVSGTGTSADTLHLSGSPLRLQESTGNSHLQLQFRTALKTQEFIQNTTTHVVRQR
jgi:hypothetical protein